MMKRLLVSLLVAIFMASLLSPAQVSAASNISVRFTAGCYQEQCYVVRYVRDYKRTVDGRKDVKITGVWYSGENRYTRSTKVYWNRGRELVGPTVAKRHIWYGTPGTTWTHAGSHSWVCGTPSDLRGKQPGLTRYCVQVGQLN